LRKERSGSRGNTKFIAATLYHAGRTSRPAKHSELVGRQYARC
jgi:hypothetical protein